MGDDPVTLELIYAKLVEVHEDIRAMREDYATIMAMLRDIENLRTDITRRVH